MKSNIYHNLASVILLTAMSPLAFADKAAGAGGGGGTTEGDKGAGTGTGDKPKGQGAVDPTVIGKRRKLGLAMVALIAAARSGKKPEIEAAVATAEQALTDNGYSALKPQAERQADCETRLQAAIKAGDGAAIVKLGKEMEAIKAGRPYNPNPPASKAKTQATAK